MDEISMSATSTTAMMHESGMVDTMNEIGSEGSYNETESVERNRRDEEASKDMGKNGDAYDEDGWNSRHKYDEEGRKNRVEYEEGSGSRRGGDGNRGESARYSHKRGDGSRRDRHHESRKGERHSESRRSDRRSSRYEGSAQEKTIDRYSGEESGSRNERTHNREERRGYSLKYPSEKRHNKDTDSYNGTSQLQNNEVDGYHSNEYNGYGKSRKSRRSRSKERERRSSTRGDSNDRHSSRKRSSSRSKHRKGSKWDNFGGINEGEEELHITSFQGGFSSAPPPPASPPPPANAQGNSGDGVAGGGAANGIAPDSAAVASPGSIGGVGQVPSMVHGGAVVGKLLTAAEIEFDKKQRRLYIGNLPPGSPQDDIIAFFNGALLAVIAASGESSGMEENELPVSKCEVYNVDSRFCFLEFRTLQLTWMCLKLDGIAFNGYSLRVGRPHDYVPLAGDEAAMASIAAGFDGNNILKDIKPATAPPREEGADQKVFIQNLPNEMGDEQVKDLLEQFGSLRVLNIIKDVSTGISKGYGFFEYEDSSNTDSAIKALNGLLCGTNVLCVQRASFSGPQSAENKKEVLVTSLPSSMTQRILSHALVGLQVEAARKIGSQPSKVVQLLNIVFQEDLLDDNHYNELLEEIKGEAEKYGPLQKIVIPRPSTDLLSCEGIGKAFLLFGDETTARRAQMMMNGRKFDGTRVVCAAFYPEGRFLEGKYSLV